MTHLHYERYPENLSRINLEHRQHYTQFWTTIQARFTLKCRVKSTFLEYPLQKRQVIIMGIKTMENLNLVYFQNREVSADFLPTVQESPRLLC